MKRIILLAIMAMNLALATPNTPLVFGRTNGACATRPQTFQDWLHQLKFALSWL